MTLNEMHDKLSSLLSFPVRKQWIDMNHMSLLDINKSLELDAPRDTLIAVIALKPSIQSSCVRVQNVVRAREKEKRRKSRNIDMERTD
jgi:hypothetical protein